MLGGLVAPGSGLGQKLVQLSLPMMYRRVAPSRKQLGAALCAACRLQLSSRQRL